MNFDKKIQLLVHLAEHTHYHVQGSSSSLHSPPERRKLHEWWSGDGGYLFTPVYFPPFISVSLYPNTCINKIFFRCSFLGGLSYTIDKVQKVTYTVYIEWFSYCNVPISIILEQRARSEIRTFWKLHYIWHETKLFQEDQTHKENLTRGK